VAIAVQSTSNRAAENSARARRVRGLLGQRDRGITQGRAIRAVPPGGMSVTPKAVLLMMSASHGEPEIGRTL
jgi:hypothetical protein